MLKMWLVQIEMCSKDKPHIGFQKFSIKKECNISNEFLY